MPPWPACSSMIRSYPVWGDGSVQPSTLIGIIFGVMSGYVYNRFKHIKLPEAIQFWRLQICTAVHGFVLDDICMDHAGDSTLVQRGLDAFYDLTVHMGAFGLFLYGILYRVLTAFGLHHLLNNVYWFQLGSYETEDGVVVQGICPDSSRGSHGRRFHGRFVPDHDVCPAGDRVCHYSGSA